ncbi:unnamed protein product, partial [Anisakis simplex]
AGGLYPKVQQDDHRSTPNLGGSSSAERDIAHRNSLTIKLPSTRYGVDDVPFKLNPSVQTYLSLRKMGALPALKVCDRARLDSLLDYSFNLERATLSNP